MPWSPGRTIQVCSGEHATARSASTNPGIYALPSPPKITRVRLVVDTSDLGQVFHFQGCETIRPRSVWLDTVMSRLSPHRAKFTTSGGVVRQCGSGVLPFRDGCP